MKIYFAGSIRAGRQDAGIYRQLISGLKEFSEVLTEHIGDDLPLSGEDLPAETIFLRDRQWVEEADVLVAEVTQPSTGVGYEIGHALAHDKPVYCLFRPNTGKSISPMLEGNTSVTVLQYDEVEEVVPRIKKLLLK